MPQCAQCRSKKVEIYSKRPVKNTDANVISERRRVGAEAHTHEDRAEERAANPTPHRSDVGCDKVNYIVGARTSNDGCVEYFIHWTKLNGEEYPVDTCTWEPRGAPGVKESSLDAHYLVGTVVESSTAKRLNECSVTEYDTARKRFKLKNEKGKEVWKNFHKPDKNHSWTVAGFDEDQPATSGDESSDTDSQQDSQSEPEQTQSEGGSMELDDDE